MLDRVRGFLKLLRCSRSHSLLYLELQAADQIETQIPNHKYMLAYFSQPRGDIGVVITNHQSQMTTSNITKFDYYPSPSSNSCISVRQFCPARSVNTSLCCVIIPVQFPKPHGTYGMIIGYSSPVPTSVSRSPTSAHAGCLLNVPTISNHSRSKNSS